MDLPTCPACKQSVLDDDAVECPFCGANLKGGSASSRPSSPPATRPASKRSSPPAKLDPTGSGSGERPQSAETRPAAKASAKAAKPADDDPFAIDDAATAKAIPASPKPAPGKTLEVKCPMCETVGYVSPKAAGQQVKCCNPKCLVPIFSAPPPPKVEAPPPPPPKKSPVALYAIIGVLVVGGGGFALWTIFGSSGSGPKQFDPNRKIENKLISQDQPATDDGTATPGDETKTAVEKVPPEIELRNKALRKSVEIAVSVPPLRKAYCRRLSATAFLASGDVAGGREQLDQLQKIGKQTPYEGCLPTTLLAWAQVSQPDAFAASVAEAKTLSVSLPKRGRYAIEAAVATAAVQAAAGKPAEAVEMLAAHSGAIELEELASASQVVQHNGTFDLDDTLIGRTLGDWNAPRETAVALILAAHSRWDDAQAWATQLADPIARGEATIAWAEAFARAALTSDPSVDLKRVEAAADALGPAVKARLLARLSAVALQAKNKEKSEEYLLQALQLLKTIPEPGKVSLANTRAIHDYKLPDSAPLRQAAEAAAEIGLVEAQLSRPELAWEHVELGLRYLRATAPALGLMQPRLAEVEGDSGEKVRGDLKSSLQLKTDDQVRRAFAKYRQQVTELERAATTRTFWQAEILEAAARAGLIDQVWNQLQVSESRPDTTEREPFLATAVPYVLADQFAKAGKADLHAAALKAAEGRFENTTSEHQARITRELTRQAIDAGDVNGAIAQLNETLHDDGTLHQTALRFVCRLVKAGKLDDATQLATKLRETILREDGLFFAAAIASRRGQAQQAWGLVPSGGGQYTEAASMITGLVSGMARTEKTK